MTTPNGGLPRRWDDFEVYLFDIDGTLLHCSDSVHYFAFCSVLESIAGRPMSLDGVVAHGNTDIGILRDAFALAGVNEVSWRARLPEIEQAMCDFVEAREQELCVSALTGVRAVLEHLRSRNAMLGVATGNLERIGRLKLERAGLLPLFQFGCWSDSCESRTEVFRGALEHVRSVVGHCASICAVGDTPIDVAAAHENGVPIVAVATGIYSVATLAACDPELCVSSLEELLDPALSRPA